VHCVPNQATNQLTIEITGLRVVYTKTQHTEPIRSPQTLWRLSPPICLTEHGEPTKYTLDVKWTTMYFLFKVFRLLQSYLLENVYRKFRFEAPTFAPISLKKLVTF